MRRVGTMALALSVVAGCTSEPVAPDTPGVFILGVDGMDPVILRRMVDEGKMPAFAEMMECDECFDELGTSWPPQSPVAWSNFVTGMNPGGHGIYDFIHRDPATYGAISSATMVSDAEPPGTLTVGDYILPLGGEDALNNRGGVPFWDLLDAAGVDTEIYRIPANYPVPASEARVLAGMGTVDMRGGYGTYTFYTSQPLWEGDVEVVRVVDTDLDGVRDRVRSRLLGPPDMLRAEPGPDGFVQIPLEVSLDPENPVALIDVGGSTTLIGVGEWSEWVEVNFDALPYGMMALSGMVRFYLKSIPPRRGEDPDLAQPFQLYASPVNINPFGPFTPITSPDEFTEELAERLGHFYTQGMPEETSALQDGVFDDDDYQLQVGLVHQETAEMVDMALERFDSGDMSFVYVSDIDLQCHMLWRHGDPKTLEPELHPAHDPEAAEDHADDIEGYYQSVDALLATVRESLPEDTLLMVMSDHGFQPHTRQFHLNNWLLQNGYLYLDGRRNQDDQCEVRSTAQIGGSDDPLCWDVGGAEPGSGPDGVAQPSEDTNCDGTVDIGDCHQIDWSRTVAYGMGFNGLYLNLEGREGQGSVSPEEAEALLEEIRAGLLAVEDPERDGARIVLEVVTPAEVYSGNRLAEAPDLLIGYDSYYGASEESTQGQIVEWDYETNPVPIADNLDGFSGSHLMAPSVVPGVLLLDRPISDGQYDLTDLTATLLDYYGLTPAEGMVGTSILEN